MPSPSFQPATSAAEPPRIPGERPVSAGRLREEMAEAVGTIRSTWARAADAPAPEREGPGH